MNLHNPPAPAIWTPRGRTLPDAHAGQDSTPAVTLSLLSDHSRAGACAAWRARPLLLRWPTGRRRAAGVALAAAGCAATWAAVIAAGPLSRGTAVQVLFAVAMIIGALGESLLSPAVPVTTSDRARPGAAGRRKRLSTCALVAGCLLGPAAGGAALGAGWGTSLLTALAVACALAGIAAQRPPVSWHRSHRSPQSARPPVSPILAAQADPIGGCAPRPEGDISARAARPPLTWITWPATKEAAGDTRVVTNPVTSAGRPARPTRGRRDKTAGALLPQVIRRVM